MPSATCTRRWGGGMSCVGRTRRCESVSVDHMGKVPGVCVGQHWRYRVQASEAGVHRTIVSGIHGSSTKGCFSICLSGGYEDDVDDGDEVLYTGSGGRDLSGNKRTAKQSRDQTLERGNLALAINCFAHDECPDCTVKKACGYCLSRWREGRPIRVCRSYKNKSPYAPTRGVRYDGIYKVVDYWPEKGVSGFVVYRYKLRRDDDEPAPWSPEGKKRVEQWHLDAIDDDDDDAPAEQRPPNTEGATEPAASQKQREEEQEKEQQAIKCRVVSSLIDMGFPLASIAAAVKVAVAGRAYPSEEAMAREVVQCLVRTSYVKAEVKQQAPEEEQQREYASTQ
eukprot:m51a1_g11463 putative e3 ubiquitin-protein ligase uhrf1 (337) ;mRNA; r:12483-14621